MIVLGPGAYDHDKTQSFVGLATKGSYIVNDNGHLS